MTTKKTQPDQAVLSERPLNMKGHELFAARTRDLIDSLDWQPWVSTSFLTPAEQQLLEKLAGSLHVEFSGGYPGAERKLAVLSELPEDVDFSECFVCLKSPLSPEDPAPEHRHVLGALMHLGLEREVIGDIVIDRDAVHVFVLSHMADFVKDSCTRAGKSSLHFEISDTTDLKGIELLPIRINVSSLRLDAVVAALAHCSRSSAMDKIRAGDVKLNDVQVVQNDTLCHNDHVSIRRCGRFLMNGIVSSTRKQRLVLEFLQYA